MEGPEVTTETREEHFTTTQLGDAGLSHLGRGGPREKVLPAEPTVLVVAQV